MLTVLRTTWPLFLGMAMLMVGNGMQGTLLGIRGGIEGVPTQQMSIVMASYFGGFLIGSLTVPRMIQKVGHVRVFAALGSLISAILVLYPAMPYWEFWAVARLAIGFSFCGVYITAESWLNAGATNETRGQAMSAYMMVQMLGIVAGQGLLNIGDPAGFIPFVIPSVLVSLAFTPILLSTQPAPRFDTIKRMSFGRLWRVSPLGCVGVFLMGGVFSSLFGMSSVWGTASDMTTGEISAFVAAIYAGGLLFQWPIGKLSDHRDRRRLILGLAVAGAAVVIALLSAPAGLWGLLVAAALIGGVANPIYSLLLAYTNDLLDAADMAAASAGLLFLNGLGSVMGPLVTGWLMGVFGLDGFWVLNAVLLAALAGYTAWRLTRRATAEPTASYTPVPPGATPVAVEAAMDADQLPPPDEVERAA
ncbi:MFS transporter [Paracoccus sp. S-4012]|uniref:MFS transporter n=1 Tax=Paracoccus sp. S-4012 TaxID=2665648 RepID=UPI0012AF6C4F|nr:MFS transporter [Paracoccus sp. S-4012]MRX51733.1 MFS transporter [Paracoccus sp. S-4012]